MSFDFKMIITDAGVDEEIAEMEEFERDMDRRFQWIDEHGMDRFIDEMYEQVLIVENMVPDVCPWRETHPNKKGQAVEILDNGSGEMFQAVCRVCGAAGPNSPTMLEAAIRWNKAYR